MSLKVEVEKGAFKRLIFKAALLLLSAGASVWAVQWLVQYFTLEQIMWASGGTMAVLLLESMITANLVQDEEKEEPKFHSPVERRLRNRVDMMIRVLKHSKKEGGE